MPAHDWTLVKPGIFHDFHSAWIAEIRNALNEGLLPPDYYALIEQHASRFVVDLLTLQSAPGAIRQRPQARLGTAVAEAPPKVRRKLMISESSRLLRRTITIRHVSGHRLVAILEIVSPANKDRPAHVLELVNKLEEALRRQIHILLIDLFPPRRHDPRGIHGSLWERFADHEVEPIPASEPLTFVSYVADDRPEAYLEHVAVGTPLPQMPLFLDSEHYINVPLEQTYQEAARGMPALWREVLEGKKKRNRH